MKKFLIKLTFLGLIFPLSIAVTLILINVNSNNISNADKPIFIWGDSQTYQGLNLKILQTELNRNIYSAAIHGAGIYDFLIFTEKVPDSSEVIIAISKLVQLRRKERDRNKSGLSLFALKALSINNYSNNEILSIIKRNIKPPKLFSSKSSLYKYSDSITMYPPVSSLEMVYKEIPIYLSDKQELYIKGITNLKYKGCKITFIEFPYHQKLINIEKKSVVFYETESFKGRISRIFNDFEIDSIYIEKDGQIMHDLTHLNELGASILSSKLSLKLKTNERTTLYIAH